MIIEKIEEFDRDAAAWFCGKFCLKRFTTLLFGSFSFLKTYIAIMSYRHNSLILPFLEAFANQAAS